MKLFLQILIALLASALGSSAFAQAATLGIEPPVMMHQAVPGQTITFNLKIGNPSPKPLKVRVNLGDWNYNQFGELLYYSSGKLPTSAAPWTRLSNSEVTLKAQDTTQMRYTITVPKDGTPGSHWGMIFFTAESVDVQPGVIAASQSVRVAHTFYVNLPPFKSTGKIAGIFGKPGQNDTKNYLFAVNYQNSGNLAQIVQGRLEVRDASGKVVAGAVFRTQVVLPGAMRIMQATLNGPLPVGDYTALVVLNYGDKGKDVAGEYSFSLKKPLAEP
jgi:Bacterial protein of unknown function (DUF916)